jgi:hypothetical protein
MECNGHERSRPEIRNRRSANQLGRHLATTRVATTTAATKLALRLLGGRDQALDGELARVDAELDRLTTQAAPELRQLCGVGPEIAGALWVAAGDTPHATAQPGRVLDAVRRLPDPGLLRQDGTAPPEPGWEPPGQHGAVPDRGGPAGLASANPRRPGPADQTRVVEAGDHPVLKAVCGPRGLRSVTSTHGLGRHRLTIYRSVTAEATGRGLGCEGWTIATAKPVCGRQHQRPVWGTNRLLAAEFKPRGGVVG